jgi:uncharacterized protein (TIGR00303 family)
LRSSVQGEAVATSAAPTAVLFPHAPERGRALAARLRGKRPLFVCVIASTDTALIPGISAAGASLELIPFTAAADAEVLAHGAARCIAGLPCNPLGPPGPALITLAALQLAAIPHLIVDAGCRVSPDAPCVSLGAAPGGLITAGAAVPQAHELFEGGCGLGRELADQCDYVVLGESVPGGTTTALALLLALGIEADGRVSSSLAGNAHDLKTRVAREALRNVDAIAVASDPLSAVAALGDPMQAAAAGIVVGAGTQGIPVLLAGGTQMIALLALLHRLAAAGHPRLKEEEIAVATTRWVVQDPTADAVGLMRDVGAEPLLATNLSFESSRHAGLRRYEEHLVKEGVGAGGATIAANLVADVPCEALRERVECLYEGIFQAAL